MNCRWYHGHPPLSPYGTLSRAITVGTPYSRAAERAATSDTILAIEYVGNIERWLSPNASVSRNGWVPAGSYTAVDEQWKTALLRRQSATTNRTLSPLAATWRSN